MSYFQEKLVHLSLVYKGEQTPESPVPETDTGR